MKTKTRNRAQGIANNNQAIANERKRIDDLVKDVKKLRNHEIEQRLMLERRVLGEIEKAVGNMIQLGVAIEHLRRPWRQRARDWIRGLFRLESDNPPALALWVTAYQHDKNDQIKIFATAPGRKPPSINPNESVKISQVATEDQVDQVDDQAEPAEIPAIGEEFRPVRIKAKGITK